MIILKIILDSCLVEEIEKDAENLKIGEFTEPKFNPPDNGKNQILLGSLPEDLKVLRRLVLWYNHQIKLGGEVSGCSEKKKFVEGLYDRCFKREYKLKTPDGYVAQVFKGWLVIANPKYF
jgi:hypothetical protein